MNPMQILILIHLIHAIFWGFVAFSGLFLEWKAKRRNK